MTSKWAPVAYVVVIAIVLATGMVVRFFNLRIVKSLDGVIGTSTSATVGFVAVCVIVGLGMAWSASRLSR